jgi:hypothetical protein
MTGSSAATWGLAAVTAVGLIRRVDEARRERSGAPVDTHVAGALGNWIPEQPRTQAGRVAAAAWAAPLTTVGALLARAGGSRLRWDGPRGCWVARDVGGPSGWILARLGLQANTIGHVVLVRTPTASEALLDHEAVHVRQGERLGPLLPLLYAGLSATHGYRDNPLERAARMGAERIRTAGP